MQAVKEKVKDTVSAAKAKAKEKRAKAEEKAEAASARSHVERELAHERGKDKVAAAKMELHQEKAMHHEEAIEHRLHKHGGHGRYQHGLHGVAPGSAAAMPGNGVPPASATGMHPPANY